MITMANKKQKIPRVNIKHLEVVITLQCTLYNDENTKQECQKWLCL